MVENVLSILVSVFGIAKPKFISKPLQIPIVHTRVSLISVDEVRGLRLLMAATAGEDDPPLFLQTLCERLPQNDPVWLIAVWTVWSPQTGLLYRLPVLQSLGNKIPSFSAHDFAVQAEEPFHRSAFALGLLIQGAACLFQFIIYRRQKKEAVI